MPQRLDELLQNCTVKISIPGQPAWGTGFLVAPGTILTCAHVVKTLDFDDMAQISWQQRDGFATAETSQLIPKLDLALLQFSAPDSSDMPCVYLDEDFQPNDDLYAYGYSDTFPQGTSVTGQCEGAAMEKNSPLIVFKLAQVRPGLSGSPLLNLRTKKVCGVVKFTRDRTTDLGGGAVPTSVILEQLPQLKALQQKFHESDQRWNELLDQDATSKPGKGFVNVIQRGKYNIYSENMSGTHIGDTYEAGNSTDAYRSANRFPISSSNRQVDQVDYERRLHLFSQLSALPKPTFEQLIFVLSLPQGIISSSSAAQGDRVKDLLDWATGPSGCGLTTLEKILEKVLEQ